MCGTMGSRDIEGYRGIGARPYPYREGHRGRGTSGTSGTCSLHRVEINTHLLRQATDLHGKECGNKFPSKDVDKVGTSDVHRDIRHQTDDLVFKFRPKSCRIPILALLAHLALLISHLSTNQSQPESKNVENHCSMRELYTPVFGMLVSGHSHAVWKYPVFKYSSINELPASTCLKMFQVSKHVLFLFFQDESNCTLGVARTPGACAKNSLTAKVLNWKS